MFFDRTGKSHEKLPTRFFIPLKITDFQNDECGVIGLAFTSVISWRKFVPREIFDISLKADCPLQNPDYASRHPYPVNGPFLQGEFHLNQAGPTHLQPLFNLNGGDGFPFY